MRMARARLLASSVFVLALMLGALVGVSSSTAAIRTDLPAKQVNRVLSEWRTRVDGHPLPARRRDVLETRAVAQVAETKARVRSVKVVGSAQGPAVYLDLVTTDPASTLRRADRLVFALERRPYLGGWAVGLRSARGGTVWTAGHTGNWGFVWSRPDLEPVSPVAHW